MKRLFAAIIAGCLTFSMAGCSSQQQVTESSSSPAAASTGQAVSNDTSASLGVKIAKEDLKIGVIHIGDPSSGSGYTYMHDLGIQQMQANLGLSDDQIIRKNNVDDGDPTATETAIRECIEDGCNVIFATSWGFMDTTAALADEFPDVIFAHCSGYMNNGKNFSNYFGRIYQARYLSGIAAGMKTQSDKIGYVSAMGKDNAECTGGIDAFALGVESVNPDAKVYVKVTNSWYSPSEETNCAKALIAEGCDVIAQHCDTPNPQLEAESAGVWGIGYNSDMTKDAPKATITSVIWNWGVFYTAFVQSLIDGTYDCSNYYGGMAEGLVDITPLSDVAAPGTQEKIDAARAKILDGSFNVFDGALETNDGQTIGTAGGTLDDKTITQGINWYYKNVIAD